MPKLQDAVGEVPMLVFPDKSKKYRWITKRRSDGRYLGRPIKLGVRYWDAFYLKRDKDFGKESLIPVGTKVWSHWKLDPAYKKRKTMKKKN
jgi:hypothetical protein